MAGCCGGRAFGAAAGPRGPAELVFLELAGGLVSLLVWLAFGAIAVPIVAGRVHLAVVAYAILSLTLLRLAPVALACAGAGLDRATVLFVGWFGPRGLASLVFALLAVEELGAAAGDAAAVIGLTVLMSVLLHGLSARPLAPGMSGLSRGPATAMTAKADELSGTPLII
ncbi:cation:proton antiporter [Nonomuraea sp. NPDC050691]|uniref:cation:proton antiporter domain-containing protein n=1 Tax=Nonomuraea sp. NPDC050691 TaxID=3155661 RepID=UPI0033E175C7